MRHAELLPRTYAYGTHAGNTARHASLLLDLSDNMDDEEQHNERFDVDNDFEGGEWIGGEFFYRNKRQKKQQTEEDRIYGVFAENSSDDEDGRRGQRGGGAKADLTKPVAFVSKGVAQPKDPPEDENRPGLGGLGSSGVGLGFAPPMSAQQQSQEKEDDDEVELNVPSAFGQRCVLGACADDDSYPQLVSHSLQHEACSARAPCHGSPGIQADA